MATKEHQAETQSANGHRQTRTVAICGTASSSRDEILQQPPEVELWGLNKSYKWMPRWDAWFDMHDHAPFRDPEHIEWLAKQTCPVYMREHYTHIPPSIRYPMKEVLDNPVPFDTRFGSMIPYMMALAIHERVGEIRLLGVDMAVASEYAYQREDIFYWIGVAKALGIKVYIPDVSPLSRPSLYGADNPLLNGHRAAMDWKDRVALQVEKDDDEFIDKLLKLVSDYRRNKDACRGALQLAEKLVHEAERPVAVAQED
jgi:hypothetical protein